MVILSRSCHHLAMILTSVPCIMICHDLSKGTLVNYDLATLTIIMAIVPWLRTLGTLSYCGQMLETNMANILNRLSEFTKNWSWSFCILLWNFGHLSNHFCFLQGFEEVQWIWSQTERTVLPVPNGQCPRVQYHRVLCLQGKIRDRRSHPVRKNWFFSESFLPGSFLFELSIKTFLKYRWKF